jgi:phage terminase small subunit
VLEELWAIAVADPRELIEYRRTCCRHCWGLEHEYQRTTREIYGRPLLDGR